jgi:signal transduction histidine kinase
MDIGHRRPFTEDDARLLALLASLASTAINNAQLYTQVVQLSQQLEHKVAERESELAGARGELAEQAAQLQRLLAATVRVQEEERARIAIDLHDGSNQLITGALFEIQAARESLLGRRGKVTLAKLETAKDLLRQIEAENRRIIAGLRPPMLDTQGLIPAVKWLANNYRASHGVEYALHVRGEPTRLAPNVETAIYRIVQETLSNVAAHAQAMHIEIRLDFAPAWLNVVVEDDGVGFDPEHVQRTMPEQLGLIGMRERAQRIGGRLEVRSLPGSGTRIVLDLPLLAEPTPPLLSD